MVYSSNESKTLEFTPVEAWTIAPVITSVKQTGEGEITILWTHNTLPDFSCEYEVMLITKTLGIKTGETVIAKTANKEAVLRDILNGEYCYTVVPYHGEKRGTASDEASVTVINIWSDMPQLSLKQLGYNQIRINWQSATGVDKYHICVYSGDSNSLLQFIDMDYRKYTEFDVTVDGDEMETIFTYPDAIDPDKGIKLKFEVYGIRITEDGNEQFSATASQTITLKAE